MKTYRLRGPIPDDVLTEFSPLVRTLLYNRGITDANEAKDFLNPDYEKHIHDASLLKDIDIAVKRIKKAVDENEKIGIFSDYDTDGIPGAVILHDFFRAIKYTNFINYIPHRNKEGFGLNTEAIDTLSNEGVTLLITLDCGITNVEEVAHAHKKGMEVIVTDHHLAGEKVPEAVAIVNPKQETCTYPEDMLCGSGVVFKLVQALLDAYRDEWNISVGWEKWLLDMVGIATLSDMVPLRGENRVFARYGLMVLRKSRRPGLQKLLRKVRVYQKTLTEEDVGFMIGPRINAASRMGIPMDAFRMLATRDENEADRLVTHLNSINDKRKGMVASMTRSAHKKVYERHGHEPQLIAIGDPDWQPSLLGLLANKLMEEYRCPVFTWGRGEGSTIKGSCRAPEGVNVVELMRGVPEGVFIEAGGHAQAGGFSVTFDAVHTFGEELLKVYGDKQKDAEIQIGFDATLSLDDIHDHTIMEINMLAPYGMDNEKPLFKFEGVVPENVRGFGKTGEHLEIAFRNSKGAPLRAIGFFMNTASFAKEPVPGKPIDLLAHVEESNFNGNREVRMRIVDVI